MLLLISIGRPTSGRSVKVIWTGLFVLIFILQNLNQFYNLFKWFCRVSEATVKSLFEVTMPVSFANVVRVVLVACSMSEVMMLYKMGTRIFPWWTPVWIYWEFKSFSSQRIIKNLLVKKDLIVNIGELKKQRILWKRPACQIRFKTCARSRKTLIQYFFSLEIRI